MGAVHQQNIQKTPWYQRDTQELLRTLDTSQSGLSGEAVAQRQEKYGKNILPGHKAVHPITIFLHQFKNPLIYILLIATIVSLAIGDIKDALFIFAVILINALIGAFQEWKAEKGASALQELLKTYAKVRRNNQVQRIDAEELVPGDIIYLESGIRVPADIRILEAHSLQLDESLLTGESVIVQKTDTPLPEEQIPVSEQTNMLFAGTTVATGRTTGIVVETALSTELGKIAQSVSESAGAKTPLLVRMEKFSKYIGYLVLVSCAVLAVVAVFQGIPPSEVFFMSVALAVSAIPEGLPVAMTVALSVATSRMTKRQVIIRKLTAVEGLGSCTVIATDKTGTLTLNRQTTQLISIANQRYRVSGEGYSGEGEITSENGQEPDPSSRNLVEVFSKTAILCNEASLYQENDEWRSEGDPVDIALLALGYKAGINPSSFKESVKELGKIPYESERMYSALFYRQDGQDWVAVKGASETLLPKCTTWLTTAGEIPLPTEEVSKELQQLTTQGYRVLVIARGKIPELQHVDKHVLQDLCFIGFAALIDPLRPEAKSAIKECHGAGIKVAMVTGDHPSTALAIAQELGIANTLEDLMTGEQLTQLEKNSPEELLQTLQHVSVFARVTPLQKLQIVEGLISIGHYVAVTGDGVNDAPALKTANIGVAMGTGTDVAKDAASIIITDDNFASIVAGVEEGRFAYDNIRKVIYLLISTGLAEVCLFILAVLAKLPLPLMAIQLLWLNLVTNGIQHIALTFEKGEMDAIRRPPRRPNEGVFNKLMLQETGISGITMGTTAFFVWSTLLSNGWDEYSARNLLLLLMVLFENIHAFNCRSELQSTFRIPIRNNPLLILGVLGAQGLHILAMHIPLMQNILQLEPVSWTTWLWQLSLASILLLVMEIFKYFKRKQSRRI